MTKSPTLDSLDAPAPVIALTRSARLRHSIESLREGWQARAKEAENLSCTAENAKAIKERRAALRRDFDALDRQRRAVRERYMSPWEKLDAVWRACVEDPFREADGAYKGAVAAYESRVLAACEEGLRAWYKALQRSDDLSWLSYERALEACGARLTFTEAKLYNGQHVREAVCALSRRVRADTERLAQMDDAAAVLAEYRLTLDAGASAALVEDRRRRERRERLLLDRAARAADAPLYPRFSFTVLDCTHSELLRLREYLRGEGIRYE